LRSYATLIPRFNPTHPNPNPTTPRPRPAPPNPAQPQPHQQFVHDHLRDPVDGDWVWSTDAKGSKVGGSTRAYQKGNWWKATYHSTRSLMLLDEWMSEVAD